MLRDIVVRAWIALRSSIVRFPISSFVLTVMAVAAGCSSKSAATDAPAAAGSSTSAAVGPNGGTFANADGSVKLNVPAGALSTDITFTSERIASPPAGAHGAYEIGPSGTTFTTPATLTLRYDSASLPAGTNVEALRLATYVGGRWELVPGGSVDSAAGTVSGSIEHLSPYGAVDTTSCSQSSTTGGEPCSITCAAPDVAVCAEKADGTASGATTTTTSCTCQPAPPPTDAGTTQCTGSEISCGDHCCPGGSTCLGSGCM